MHKLTHLEEDYIGIIKKKAYYNLMNVKENLLYLL